MDELSYEERLVKCDLVSLELRLLRKDLAICYQMVNGLIWLNYKKFFLSLIQTVKPVEIDKGSKFQNFLIYCQNEFLFCTHCSSRLQNSLTNEINLCGNYNTFCKKLEIVDLSMHLNGQWDIPPES